MNFTLSKRLEKIAKNVQVGSIVADVGTDHAYIPIYLVKNNISPKVIAMDINNLPLIGAKDNIDRYRLSKQIECRLSNGLEKLKYNEVDTIIISGMGGDLISNILLNGREVLKTVNNLILQPQSEQFKVRHTLHNLGYKIIFEDMFIDDNKSYNIIKAIKGKESYDLEIDYIYGKYLLETKNNILVANLNKELKKYIEIKNQIKVNSSDIQKSRINDKIKGIKEALSKYDL